MIGFRFQCDNIGKDIRLAAEFPQLISPDFKHLSIGQIAHNYVFNFCVRRFIVSNQAQILDIADSNLLARQVNLDSEINFAFSYCSRVRCFD